MYRYVVSVSDTDRIVVEQITDIGNIGPKQTYSSIDELPNHLAEKVKQLMWLRDDDQSFIEGIGTKVGKNSFWII